MDKAQVSLLLNAPSNQKGLTVYIAQVSQCPGWPMVNGRNITTGDQLQYWWKWALKEKRKGTALHTRSYTDWPEQAKIHDCEMAKLVATRQTTPNHLSKGNMSRLNQLATSISLSMVSIGQGYLCYFSIQSCLCHWKTKKKICHSLVYCIKDFSVRSKVVIIVSTLITTVSLFNWDSASYKKITKTALEVACSSNKPLIMFESHNLQMQLLNRGKNLQP